MFAGWSGLCASLGRAVFPVTCFPPPRHETDVEAQEYTVKLVKNTLFVRDNQCAAMPRGGGGGGGGGSFIIVGVFSSLQALTALCDKSGSRIRLRWPAENQCNSHWRAT